MYKMYPLRIMGSQNYCSGFFEIPEPCYKDPMYTLSFGDEFTQPTLEEIHSRSCHVAIIWSLALVNTL